MLNCVSSWDKNNFYYLRIIAIQWFIVGGFFGGMVCYIIWGAQFKNENAGLSLGIGNQFPFPKNPPPWPMQIRKDHNFMLGCSQYLDREWMRGPQQVLLEGTMELPAGVMDCCHLAQPQMLQGLHLNLTLPTTILHCLLGLIYKTQIQR